MYFFIGLFLLSGFSCYFSCKFIVRTKKTPVSWGICSPTLQYLTFHGIALLLSPSELDYAHWWTTVIRETRMRNFLARAKHSNGKNQRFLVTEYILKHRQYPQQLPIIYVIEWKGVYSRFSIRIQILYGSPLHCIPTVHLNAALTSIFTQEHHYQWEQEVSCWWNSLTLYSQLLYIEVQGDFLKV